MPNPYLSDWGPPCTGNWDENTCIEGYSAYQNPEVGSDVRARIIFGDSVIAISAADDLVSNTASVTVKATNRIPGEAYDFSYAVRTDSLLSQPEIGARAQGSGGAGFFGDEVLVYGPKGTSSWQRVHVRLAVPRGANSIRTYARVKGDGGHCNGESCGTAYFDDPIMTPIENHAWNHNFSAINDYQNCYGWDGPCPKYYESIQSPDTSFFVQADSVDGDPVVTVVVASDTAASNNLFRLQRRMFGLEPGSLYEMSISIKTESLKSETQFVVFARDSSGNDLGDKIELAGPSGDSDWQPLAIQYRVPLGAEHVRIQAEVRGEQGHCEGVYPCGTAHFDNPAIIRLLEHPISNVCPDGQFLPLGNTAVGCLDLDVDLSVLDAAFKDSLAALNIDINTVFGTSGDTPLGFKPNKFDSDFAAFSEPDDVFELSASECNESDLKSLLAEVEANGGGTARLPACDITLTDKLVIPSNTILQGAATGRTRLVTDETFPNTTERTYGALSIVEVENVVVRDLTIDQGGGPASIRGVRVRRGQNTLVERVELIGTKTPFSVNQSQNFTMRYNAVHDQQTVVPGKSAKLFGFGECDATNKNHAPNSDFEQLTSNDDWVNGMAVESFVTQWSPDDYLVEVIDSTDGGNWVKVVATDSAQVNRWQLTFDAPAGALISNALLKARYVVASPDWNPLQSDVRIEAVTISGTDTTTLVSPPLEVGSIVTGSSLIVPLGSDISSAAISLVVEGNSAHCGVVSCGTLLVRDVELRLYESTASCQRDLPDTYWSAGHAFYSNWMETVGPASSQATLGEFAGNMLESSKAHWKFDDGLFLWIHHNRFQRLFDSSGIVETDTEVLDRTPRGLVVYKNTFVDNATTQGVLMGFPHSHGVYVLDNTYTNNVDSGTNDMVITARDRMSQFGEASKRYVCEGTAEVDSAGVQGFTGFTEISGFTDTLAAGGPLCNFSGIGEIFNGFSSSAAKIGGAVVSAAALEAEVPLTFGLDQNYPNPFNPQTRINYQLAEVAHVKIEVFNMLGQRISLLADETQEPGRHHVVWNTSAGSPHASGVYMYRMIATGGKDKVLFTDTRRMVVVK